MALEKKKYNVDPLNLHGADNPNTVLSAITLTGVNYFSWTKSIKLSLQAKVKLGFLDGSCVKPTNDDGATQWMVVDAMVRSWILNTISKEIRANFEGTITTQDLWQEVKAHYEGNNGPTLYGLARDISTINQGNLTAEEYYSKIRLYWEEMAGINPLLKCECDGSNIANCLGCREIKKFHLIDENAKLLQFLLGLNESYENVKDQILLGLRLISKMHGNWG
ncbi:uncharacterized protein LOC124934650 [Impatiens glandulifera]|uniref:uncharacterized protein LOC124934650 n=1 Tax=Impatiens glandulifera TaxID=253017 RepID=UPI001FB063B9|nr:uncharacterized protein LOC124934650 [Impatiens glandulifera]